MHLWNAPSTTTLTGSLPHRVKRAVHAARSSGLAGVHVVTAASVRLYWRVSTSQRCSGVIFSQRLTAQPTKALVWNEAGGA